jgi:hypothetical protein
VIYYIVERDEIFMLYAYSKSRSEDISPDQARVLRALVDEHLRS